MGRVQTLPEPVMVILDSIRSFHDPATKAGRLPAGQAIGLRMNKAAVLRIPTGRVWLTLGEAGGKTPCDAGDCFLDPGDSMPVPAGAHLVMEPVAMSGETGAVDFEWAERALSPSGFALDVVKPAGGFVLALVHAGSALARLLRGLRGCARWRWAG